MNKELITFRMAGVIEFNRPIDVNKDYISPGGYTFIFGNDTIQFDFEEYSGNVNKDNLCLLHFESRNPDYESFMDLERLTKEMLNELTQIEEFFVFTGEPGESDLKPINIKSLSFLLPYENFEEIVVPEAVLKKAVLSCN